MQTQLHTLIEGARRAMAGPGRPTAAVAGELRLADMLPPIPAGAERFMSARDLQRPANDATIGAAVANDSLAARAGALIIPMAAPAAVPGGGEVGAFYKRPGRFLVVTPAPFVSVADGAEVLAVDPPVLSADFGSEYGEASHAVTFNLSRAEQRAMTDDVLHFIVAQSITRGLARLVDQVLLSAIAATMPSAFSLAAAAAHGLRFGELRAIAGTAADGAAVGADGMLRVSGVQAELSDALPDTLVGAFSRAAVAVESEIRVLASRLNVAGDLQVTAFASMTPAIADESAFFTVGA